MIHHACRIRLQVLDLMCSLSSYVESLTSLTSSRFIHEKVVCYKSQIHLTVLTLGVIQLKYFFCVLSLTNTIFSIKFKQCFLPV